MIFDTRSFLLRLLCLILICLVLFWTIVVPVYASSLLYEILGVTARSLIASLIRACGVYVADGIESQLSAGLQSFENLTDSVLAYVWENLPDELKLTTTVGTLMIKMIFQNGIYYAPRRVVELVCLGLSQNLSSTTTDYVSELGFIPRDEDYQELNYVLSLLIAEYGASFETLVTYQYCYYIKTSPDMVFGDIISYSPHLIFSNSTSIKWRYSSSDSALIINVPAGTVGDIVGYSNYGVSFGSIYDADAGSNRFIDCTSYDCYVIERQSDSSSEVTGLEGLVVEDDVGTIDSAWDDESITVTDNKLSTTAVSAVPVSVYSSTSTAATSTKTDVQSGSTVKADTVTVTESVTDVETDTDAESTTGFFSSVLSWLRTLWEVLKDILAGILSLAQSIAQPIVDAIAAAITAIKDFFTPKYDSLGFYSLPGIKDFFPFCIPFDLYAFMQVLCASPEAPSFTFACPLPGGSLYYVNIDLSAWDGVAQTVRYVIVAIYIVVLANATRKYIKW